MNDGRGNEIVVCECCLTPCNGTKNIGGIGCCVDCVKNAIASIDG